MAACIYGYHSIGEALKRGGTKGTLLVSRSNQRIDELKEAAQNAGIEVNEADDGDLAGLCGSAQHKGAVLVLDAPAAAHSADLKGWLLSLESDKVLTLVLDQITDPQNLGAILRSADQFGVDLVLLPSRRSAQENQTVQRVSSGASSYVNLLVIPNIPSALEQLKKSGFWIYGADMEGEPAHRTDLRGRVCLVMGSEGAGLRRLVRERCDALIKIPSLGHVDSFNVSVASAILMYEVRRQQGFPSS
jgi:23S rRNA (guanosine2251-2'-O)-methyltransferase